MLCLWVFVSGCFFFLGIAGFGLVFVVGIFRGESFGFGEFEIEMGWVFV